MGDSGTGGVEFVFVADEVEGARADDVGIGIDQATMAQMIQEF